MHLSSSFAVTRIESSIGVQWDSQSNAFLIRESVPVQNYIRAHKYLSNVMPKQQEERSVFIALRAVTRFGSDQDILPCPHDPDLSRDHPGCCAAPL